MFKDRIFVVDKLHYQGHVGVNCAKYCDPNLYPAILPLNSVIVEQINKWAGKHKHGTRHMSWLKFSFFLYVLFDFYNVINLQGLTPITGWKTAWVSHAEKRKFSCIDRNLEFY